MMIPALLIAAVFLLGGVVWLFYLQFTGEDSRAGLIGSSVLLTLGLMATVVAVASSPSAP
jgi:hypothetical protein